MPKRLDPDEILKQIVKLSSGRHKIYLGMAPGVGKTYRMLEEALELKKKGVDIVIGYVEIQERAENLQLINWFEAISRKKYKINEREYFDLDLEAIIERNPATVIVDELAHTNLPGSINQKRYQDVQEILENRISVISTLNIHQLESIAPIVEKNLGIKINEIVPDWILNQADEVVLIDISIDELYQRLEQKRIYNQDQLKHAYKNFFKRSNLYLLRDLALNVLAERVETDVVTEKLKAKIKDRILVAASPKETSLRFINHAAGLSKTIHAGLDVLCITKADVDKKITDKLRETTERRNGNFFLLKNIKNTVSDELIHFIKVNRITQAVLGYPKLSSWENIFFKSIVLKVLENTSNIDLLIVGHQTEEDDSMSTRIIEDSITKKQSNLNFGKLKIYIGMAPGVGKTYKMLQDGKVLYKQGVDILLGAIDTHGRTETAKLMEELPTLPYKLIEHKGKYLPELDLEGAILAKPDIILVDELAHTNVPGAINYKRYQDVQYLLRAGINVMSTVNIQHIESLNDIVQQVTGIKVRETVPDWVISHASEIVLIDLSPEALQERLKAGKIYSLDKIEQALTHFFQKKNLIALRELSLREVAESIEHEMYQVRKKTKILGFIDINKDTLRLIRKSTRIVSRLQAELIVMHIVKNTNKLAEDKKIAIIELEQLVVELGGDFRLIEGNSIIEEIVKATNKIVPDYVVLGEPSNNSPLPFLKDNIISQVLKKLPNTNVWVIGDFTQELE